MIKLLNTKSENKCLSIKYKSLTGLHISIGILSPPADNKLLQVLPFYFYFYQTQRLNYFWQMIKKSAVWWCQGANQSQAEFTT